MPYKDSEKQRAFNREWARRNITKEKRQRYQRSVRLRVIEKMGGKCVHCGCDVSEALEINHINGGGIKELRTRHKGSKGFHLDILAGRRSIDDLELTCRICNAHHYLVHLKGIDDNWKITWKPPNSLPTKK